MNASVFYIKRNLYHNSIGSGKGYLFYLTIGAGPSRAVLTIAVALLLLPTGFILLGLLRRSQ